VKATRRAASADELFALTADGAPDVIVLDLQLPRIDGWEVTRRLKADPRLRHVPIVAVSGCVLPSERENAREAGCDVFLPKPCDPDDIVREARRLVEQSRGG
jgi:two-component system cell cycle response regulator DivK